MEKERRKKGEKYLTDWANAIKNIEKLQNEIKLIKIGDYEKIDILNNSTNNQEIKNIYSTLIQEKMETLKNTIYNYKIVDDILNDLEEYQKDIIRLRYIYNKSWQYIALNVHISIRHCFNVKNFIIDRILNSI